MKKYILAFLASAAVLMAGCNNLDVAEEQVPEGEMAVRLTVSGPFSDAVRSYVSGTEADISTIMMLCFDNEGKYIVSRNATVTPSTGTTGTLTGTVPSNTCRVHFLANFTPDVSSFAMGTQERSMMKSAALSSGISDNVRFWGYHTETSSSAMATWLSGGNTVKLLRDRAKVVLTMSLNSDAEAISSLSWTIANGLTRGFVAAASTTGSNPYTNGYTTSTVVTEYTSAGKYEWTADTETQTEPAIWAAANESQYLFENRNVSDDPVKIIIKATYSDNTVRYHTVLLQDNNKVLYPVLRNSTYRLTLKTLPSSMGSETFEEALTNTNYSNNPYAQVAREVDEVNSDSFTLKVEDVVKIFYEEDYKEDATNHMVSIGFTYTGHDGGDISSLTASNFVVSWESKSEGDESGDVVTNTDGVLTTPTVTYDNTTGEGTISFPLAALEAVIHSNTLQIVATNSGLSRYIDVYSISKFNYAVAPKLVDNKTTRTSGGETREVYKLTFTLPSDYPASLYPVKVKLYTSTLSPFSDSDASSASGSFNVVVSDTGDLTESSQSSDWNYGATDWGQYYEYSIEVATTSNAYTIYLNDIIANYDRTISNVGLYFQIEGFGDPIALTAAAVVKETQTFQNANFYFSGDTGTATLGQATVTLGNSDSHLDYYNNRHYTDYALRIGQDTGDGTMTVTVPSGYVISNIDVTYFHRDEETGRNGTIYWEAKDFVGGDVTANPVTYTKDEENLTGTWTGDPTQSVTLTMSPDSDGKSPRVTAIKVTYQTKED